jgi:hypothetical protein
MFVGFIVALLMVITVEGVMLVELNGENRVLKKTVSEQARFDDKVRDIQEAQYKELLDIANKRCATTTDATVHSK